mgnify:FL=1|jgi:hypothetical protein
MKQYILIFITFLIVSCQNKKEIKKSFVKFEFESWNLAENFKLEFNGGDTIYLKQIFPDSLNFHSVLNRSEKEDLIETIGESDFNYSKKYWDDSAEDGQTYNFIIEHLNGSKDSILIHQNEGPKKLHDLAKYLKKLSKEKKFEKE